MIFLTTTDPIGKENPDDPLEPFYGNSSFQFAIIPLGAGSRSSRRRASKVLRRFPELGG